LNLDDIPSPSAHDPARNRHRATGGGRWAKSAVRAILLNPRYTGHEVWNKQRKDEVLLDVDDVALGHETKMRWNPPSEWIWSNELTHQPLIARELFDTAQSMFNHTKVAATRQPAPGRNYQLAGLMRCTVCGKSMQGQWNHGRAYYRCRYRDDYPVAEAEHPKSVYVKESLLPPTSTSGSAPSSSPTRSTAHAPPCPHPQYPTRRNKNESTSSTSRSPSATTSSLATAPCSMATATARCPRS